MTHPGVTPTFDLALYVQLLVKRICKTSFSHFYFERVNAIGRQNPLTLLPEDCIKIALSSVLAFSSTPTTSVEPFAPGSVTRTYQFVARTPRRRFIRPMMAPDKVELAEAGRKTKFSVYSMDHLDMVQFRTNADKIFTVPAALLDKHGLDWRTTYVIHDGRDGRDCEECPHWLLIDHDCIVRGFLHWLYTGEMPTSSLIRESSFPKMWATGKEIDPAGTRMALELLHVGSCLIMSDLENDAMTFIFGQYKASGMFLNVARLGKMNFLQRHRLHHFALDLYLKRCHEKMKTSKYPDDFLPELLNRMRERAAAGKSVLDPLRLSDYHTDTPLHDETCSCKDPSAGDEFIID
ncbi:hypothetical protein P171DRAFT_488149 [Karstenula rhodostoma CBS 690.94]|uniref:BTB domain-containing protein n=1 Tax=Karstenula rhodostoma CBS 690.94 TaxID=1392251 RepID=A0A9P4PER5_9PLEO|nr:hypothetical protein P171DRAFT_488149 [Karstenula rhodostoma CBS 690.94]